MLVDFRVKNVYSYRDDTLLSMVRSPDRHLEDNNVIREVNKSGSVQLLKSVALYGANASGKSNLLFALAFMRNAIVRSASGPFWQRSFPIAPFKLAPDAKDDSMELETSLAIDGVLWRYGFRFRGQVIEAEWLYERPVRERMLFEREGSTIRFGRHWVGERERLAEMTRDDALFLSVAARLNATKARIVQGWFADAVRVILSDTGQNAAAKALAEGGQPAADLKRLMSIADLGIVDWEARVLEGPDALADGGMPKQMKELISAIEGAAGVADVRHEVYSIGSFHLDSDGQRVRFDRHEESGGTNRLLELGPSICQLVSQGGVLAIDEIECHLHPNMVRALIELMHSSAQALQLIFTTHDAGLLDIDLLRRDQTWFCEKGRDGATDLYSLWDFKARKDGNLRKGYLRGRYGGVPMIRGI